MFSAAPSMLGPVFAIKGAAEMIAFSNTRKWICYLLVQITKYYKKILSKIIVGVLCL